ncbi:CCA tRNA nucleotidyltransferase 1, mitochondrial [Hydra vulgaris]|nr:CCA tRNA nucleotidyltransferase 1, mitochondrial [Hydra vulgaris]
MLKCIRASYISTTTIKMMSSYSKQLDRFKFPGIKSLLDDDVVGLCNIFIKKGFEIRIVGGAVRDVLLGNPAKDIDLSTTATPQQMVEVFSENKIRFIETGLAHGTLTAHYNGRDFQVTTLRYDIKTDGRHAKVEFTNDWKLDAERRDLTFNSMSMDVNAVLYDYFNGENDLKQGVVRFVGNVENRIREDYLRILRYFRFYGRIAPNIHSHDEKTLNTIKTLSEGLKNLAVERIWLEVSKILTGPLAPHLLLLMQQLNVTESIGFPIVLEDNLKLFETVWTQTRNVDVSPVTLLVTLLENEKIMEDFGSKWKLSNKERIMGLFIISHRSLRNYSEKCPLKPYQDLIVLNSSKGDASVRERVRQLMFYHGKITESFELDKWDIPIFPITGLDLKNCGIKQGPEFGKILIKLKKIWMNSYYCDSKEDLLKKIPEISKLK